MDTIRQSGRRPDPVFHKRAGTFRLFCERRDLGADHSALLCPLLGLGRCGINAFHRSTTPLLTRSCEYSFELRVAQIQYQSYYLISKILPSFLKSVFKQKERAGYFNCSMNNGRSCTGSAIVHATVKISGSFFLFKYALQKGWQNFGDEVV